MEIQRKLTSAERWITAAFVLIAVATAGIRPLYDPDEGRYAEIPREMIAIGDWLVPHLNYVNYLEKPPLGYWITAITFKVFGICEWAARLPNVLYYLGVIFLIFSAGRKIFGTRPGIRAAWMYATSLLPLLMGRFLTLDFALAFFLTAGLILLGMAEISRAGDPAPASAGKILAGWVFVGLAALVKGPVALVLSAGIVAVYYFLRYFFHPAGEKNTRGRWHMAGFLLALCVCLPWFFAVGRRVEPFWNFFIVDQHLNRFGGSEHSNPFWFYVPVLIVGFFPWTISFLKTMTPVKIKASFRDPDHLWFWCWAAVIFIFFSVSGGKLATYILPLFAPMAILMAASADEETDRRNAWLSAVVLALLAVVLIVAPVPARYEESLRWTFVPTSVLFGAGALITFWMIRTARRAAVHAPSVVLLLFTLLLELAGADPDVHRTAYSFRKHLAESNVPLICYGDYFQSVNFYSGRRAVVANNPGELTFGSRFAESEGWFWDESRMRDFIASGSPALVVMKSHTFRESFQHTPQIRVIDQTPSLVLASINGGVNTIRGETGMGRESP